jgi:two-component system response regulator RegX3
VAGENPRKVVLVVDDDLSYREVLNVGLAHEGFTVHLAADGKNALHGFARTKPDVVLLDLRLPDLSGSEVLKEIRKVSDTPVVMLSASNEELDIVLCFELGADDYVAKPFRLRELVARLNAAIRQHERAQLSDGRVTELSKPLEPLTLGALRVDFDSHTVELDGKPVQLSRKEFGLLVHLALTPGRVSSRAELMNEIWGSGSPDDRTLDTHIYRLRTKLEDDPTRPSWIITVRGVGFLLNDGRRRPSSMDSREAAETQPNRPLM